MRFVIYFLLSLFLIGCGNQSGQPAANENFDIVNTSFSDLGGWEQNSSNSRQSISLVGNGVKLASNSEMPSSTSICSSGFPELKKSKLGTSLASATMEIEFEVVQLPASEDFTILFDLVVGGKVRAVHFQKGLAYVWKDSSGIAITDKTISLGQHKIRMVVSGDVISGNLDGNKFGPIENAYKSGSANGELNIGLFTFSTANTDAACGNVKASLILHSLKISSQAY